jgi:hypothetical protein
MVHSGADYRRVKGRSIFRNSVCRHSSDPTDPYLGYVDRMPHQQPPQFIVDTRFLQPVFKVVGGRPDSPKDLKGRLAGSWVGAKAPLERGSRRH